MLAAEPRGRCAWPLCLCCSTCSTRYARRCAAAHTRAVTAFLAALCGCSDETVIGSRLVELLETTPLAPSAMAAALAAAAQQGPEAGNGRPGSSEGVTSAAGGRAAAEELGDSILQDVELRRLAEVVMGRIENFDLLPSSLARTKAQQVGAAVFRVVLAAGGGGGGSTQCLCAAAHR
jgi:hypothetical protein